MVAFKSPCRQGLKGFNAEIDGDTYAFRFDNERQENVCILYTSTMTDISKGLKVMNYILELAPTQFEALHLDLEDIKDVQEIATYPCLRHPKTVLIAGETVDYSKLSILFKHFLSKLECVHIHPAIKGTVDSKFEIFKAGSLYLKRGSWANGKHYQSFDGKFIMIDNARITTDQVIMYVRQWIKGTYMDLTTATVCSDYRFDIKAIVDQLDAKPWDPEKRARNLILRGVDVEGCEIPIIDCSDGFDIERSDGLLATIRVVNPNIFHFHVWHERFPILHSNMLTHR